jgi:hypothetical protein
MTETDEGTTQIVSQLLQLSIVAFEPGSASSSLIGAAKANAAYDYSSFTSADQIATPVVHTAGGRRLGFARGRYPGPAGGSRLSTGGLAGIIVVVVVAAVAVVLVSCLRGRSGPYDVSHDVYGPGGVPLYPVGRAGQDLARPPFPPDEDDTWNKVRHATEPSRPADKALPAPRGMMRDPDPGSVDEGAPGYT